MQAEKVNTILVTGFMDAGKTSFIQDYIFNDHFHKRENGKTLVISFEDGEAQYDIEKLKLFRTDVVIWEDGDEAAFIADAVDKSKPDRVFVEMNCMIPGLIDKVGDVLMIVNDIMLIDGSTLDIYFKNMQQLLYDMVSIADPILINRAETKEQLERYATSFRLMNQRAGFLWESPMGYHEKIFGNALPFDRSQKHITLSENDYPMWFIDAMEYPAHYDGKVLEMDVQIDRRQDDEDDPDSCVAGRLVMTCCANDIRFFGFRLLCQRPLPEHLSFVHLTASAEAVTDPLDGEQWLFLESIKMEKIPDPAQSVISVV